MIPEIQKSRLSNGLTLWLVEHHSLPLIVSSFLMKAGSDSDPEGKAGLAALTAEVLDTGTTSLSLAAIAERFEFVGASFRPQTVHDGTLFTLSTLAARFPETFAVVADLLHNAVYPPEEVERLRRQRLTSLLQEKDRPGTIASVVFHRRLFGDQHPYGTDAGGNEAGLRQIHHQDFRPFHDQHYTPEQTILITVGDITMPALQECVSSSLGTWGTRSGAGAGKAKPTAAGKADLIVIDRPGSVQSEIRMGGTGIARNSDDYHAVMVMNRILGGQFSSRLNRNLREKRGLTYGAWSTFQALQSPGPFVAGGAFHTDKTDEAVRELQQELEHMRNDGITVEELRFAQGSLAGSFALAFETPRQIAQALLAIPLYGLREDFYTGYLALLRQVTLDDVLRVARRYLDTSTMTTVVVGDAARIVPTLGGIRPGSIVYATPEGDILDTPGP